MKKFKIILFVFLPLFFSSDVFSEDQKYIFGWTQLDNNHLLFPRGGTSTGPDVEKDVNPNPYWLKLQNPILSKFEKDRLAILAMQGEYKVNFDFMETMGFTEGYVPEKPYQSWGTEFVIVLEEEKDFISLQHIMVMYFEDDLGGISEPIVVKHWRQDWEYQNDRINTFVGNNVWKEKIISQKERKGTWSQSVYQVDDSPRYQGFGKWKHFKNSSTWISKDTIRPLPRREATIRDDYDIIQGINIHSITPNGWVHEQNNNKVKLDNTVLAKEIGLARYQRIQNFNWDAGRLYWDKTKIFWKQVRGVWSKKLKNSKTIRVIDEIDNTPLFSRLFSLADDFSNGKENAINGIDEIINEHTISNKN